MSPRSSAFHPHSHSWCIPVCDVCCYTSGLSSPQRDLVATRQRDLVATRQRDLVATRQRDLVATRQRDLVATRQVSSYFSVTLLRGVKVKNYLEIAHCSFLISSALVFHNLMYVQLPVDKPVHGLLNIA